MRTSDESARPEETPVRSTRPPGGTAVPARPPERLDTSGSERIEPGDDEATPVRRASTTAGVALLLVAALGAFGDLGVVQRLIVPDDAVRTATNLANSEALFRLGVASLLLVACLDIVVAWALFTVFEPVSRSFSMLAATFRVAYAAIFGVAIAQLIGVLRLLPEAKRLAAQVLSGVHAYEDIWTAGLILFAFHLILLGILAWRASYVPTILGILLAIAGLGYAVDGFGDVLFAGYGANVAAFTFIGEVALLVWLLTKGPRITAGSVSRSASDLDAARL